MSIHLQVRVGVEWVNNFHAETCHQNDLSYCDDQVVGFYNHMGSHGHVKVFNWGNDNAWETDFRHPDFGGDSLNWSDDVHFCYYASHAGQFPGPDLNDDLYIAFASQHTYCLSSSERWRLGSRRRRLLGSMAELTAMGSAIDELPALWDGFARLVRLAAPLIRSPNM